MKKINWDELWVKILVTPMFIWIAYVFIMMVWATFCEKCPHTWYAKYMQPISNYLNPPEPVNIEDTDDDDDYEEFEDD